MGYRVGYQSGAQNSNRSDTREKLIMAVKLITTGAQGKSSRGGGGGLPPTLLIKLGHAYATLAVAEALRDLEQQRIERARQARQGR
jgi:hypothetical protein